MRRFILPLAILAASLRVATAAEFLVRPGGENKVVFVSKAPMERFEGKTSHLEGRIEVDPSALGKSISVHLEVDMATLDTGIAKRNQHMRDNHLETKKFPRAVFDGATIVGPADVALVAGKPTAFEAEGTFTLHGVTRPVRLRIEATYRPSGKGGRIEFQTAFPVALADHEISRPQFLFLKLGEVQDVRVSGVAVASP